MNLMKEVYIIINYSSFKTTLSSRNYGLNEAKNIARLQIKNVKSFMFQPELKKFLSS